MSEKDMQTPDAPAGDLKELNANDAVLGDEGVPPTVNSERPASQPPQAARTSRAMPQPVTEAHPDGEFYPLKRSALKHLPGVIAGTLIGTLGFGVLIGMLIGGARSKPAPPERVTVTVTVPANANSREAVAKRNVVWRVLNHDADKLPETPEKRLGEALDLLIGKDADQYARMDGFTAFIKKGAAYFNEEQSNAIEHALAEGSPAEVAEVMRKIVVADGQASDLLRGVLSDQKRIKAVVGGQKAPLETMPDGSQP